VGFWCRPSYQGRGDVTEAVRAACGFALEVLGVRRVTCLSDEANAASRAVAERAGFLLQDLLSNERVGPDGTPRTTCLYVLDRR